MQKNRRRKSHAWAPLKYWKQTMHPEKGLLKPLYFIILFEGRSWVGFYVHTAEV